MLAREAQDARARFAYFARQDQTRTRLICLALRPYLAGSKSIERDMASQMRSCDINVKPPVADFELAE